MASTETRPSFRLPWSAGPAESGERSESPAEPPEDPTEASIESPGTDEGEATQTLAMIETASPAAGAAGPEPSGAALSRRATKFMAELSVAMQAAAEHARNETMERFTADAKAVVEEIHVSATTEAADLRHKADEDVAAIREWSKAEVARIGEETEARVAARKTGLDSEIEAHAASVEARAERVTAVVAAFETEMNAFFERLNAEEDPTRIATMAETMPEPPSLEEVAAAIVAATATAPAQPALPAIVPASYPTAAPTEVDFAAAEAEAMSFDGDLGSLGDEDGTEGESASPSSPEVEPVPADSVAADEVATGARASTRVVVTGLISVASIANFKRSLARIAGVRSIGVSSGPNGEFVFTVSHDSSLALPQEIEAMPAFESQVTGEGDGEMAVSARDRDALD